MDQTHKNICEASLQNGPYVARKKIVLWIDLVEFFSVESFNKKNTFLVPLFTEL